ncbi:MAG: YtoQ family protein [Pseudomonadota bacterium]
MQFTASATDHQAGDAAGDLLGPEDRSYCRDDNSSKVNRIETRNLFEICDLAFIRFRGRF